VSTTTYAETLVKVSPELQQRLKNNYAKEPRWGQILKMLNNNNTLGLNAAKLPYELKNGLVYYKDIEKGPHLCIPHSLHDEVFKLAHDEMRHSEYARMHERLTDTLYIYDLFKNLHEYLRHCPQCQLNQTPCHKPYGALQPILSLLRPFHTLTIDFILALSVIKAFETYKTIMSVTDKFSKTVTLIPGRDTMTAEDWAICLLNHLALLNWELSRAIISDQDRKFLFNLWKEIFKQLKVDLLYSTAYHSQTNDSFKMTNKTVEIALQYWIMTLKCPEEWPKSLPRLQAALNNSTKYSSTQQSLNEVLFECKTREALNLLHVVEPETQMHKTVDVRGIQLMIMNNYQPAHIDAKDVIGFTAMQMKYYYDERHQPLYFQPGDMVNLCLHQGYTLLSLFTNKKLKQQFADLIKVLNWVERLAYRLNVPPTWQIHNVISVVHLEPAHTLDPYQWPQSEKPEGVMVDGEKEWELKKLLKKRTYWRGRGITTEYLTRWLEYEPEFDSWINVKDLEHTEELIRLHEEENAHIAWLYGSISCCHSGKFLSPHRISEFHNNIKLQKQTKQCVPFCLNNKHLSFSCYQNKHLSLKANHLTIALLCHTLYYNINKAFQRSYNSIILTELSLNKITAMTKHKVKDNPTPLNHNTWNEGSSAQHVDMGGKSNVSQTLWAEWELYTETPDYSNERPLTKVRLDNVNMYHVTLHINSNEQGVNWPADFDHQGDIQVVRANYSNPATMKNSTGQDCYAVYRGYYQLCGTKGSKHVKTRYTKNRTDEGDTFRSGDKVIQFTNIGSSNAESPTKTPKPLTTDPNQAEPSTNTSEAGPSTTIPKRPITMLMIEDDSESSETTAPIKQGPLFISRPDKPQGPHYIPPRGIRVEIPDPPQQLSTFKQKADEAELQTPPTDKQRLMNQLKNCATREKSSNAEKVSAPPSVINITFLKALVLMILDTTARLSTWVQEQVKFLQQIQGHMAEAIMNLNGLKKSVNATLVYTEETQNTLTDLVNISGDLIKHLKVLKRTADAAKLKAIEDGWKAPDVEAERYLIVWKGKEVNQNDKRWGNAFFGGWQFVIVILVIRHPDSIVTPLQFAFFALCSFLFWHFSLLLSFLLLTWHDVILVSKRVYSWGKSPE